MESKLTDFSSNNSISPWIQTTDNCNIKCPYCYVENKNTMGYEVYDNILGTVKNSENTYWHMRLGGGEPILAFDIWKKFATEAYELPNVSIELLTNLQVATERHINFINENNINVSVSIDNDEKFKPLTDEIKGKVKLLKNQPYIMTTLLPGYNNLCDLADYIGKNNIGWAISTEYSNGKLDPVTIEHLFKAIDILKSHNYDILNNFSFNNVNFSSSKKGCSAGREMFAIYCDGKIYKCQTLIYDKNLSIGNVETNEYYPCKGSCNTLCEKCAIEEFCSGWCSIYHTKNSFMCEVMKLVTYKILE